MLYYILGTILPEMGPRVRKEDAAAVAKRHMTAALS